jgi:retinol dehydrogenase-12
MAERHEDSIFNAMNENSTEYMADRYNTTKLLEVFMVRELAEKMQSGRHATQPVIINTLHPGVCKSSILRDLDGLRAGVTKVLMALVARTAEMGSRTLVAAAQAGDDTHGQYLRDCQVVDASPFVRSEEGKKTQARVYDELINILENIQPGISQKI